MRIPGRSAEELARDLREEQLAPTADELTEIFDEQEQGGELSADSWIALLRLASIMDLDPHPIHVGTLVCRPDDDEFEPWRLEGLVPERRLVDLIEHGATPTPAEIDQWREEHMEAAFTDDASGLFRVMAQTIADSHPRKRLLVTLHGDQAMLEGVVGVFRSADEARTYLSGFGNFGWD